MFKYIFTSQYKNYVEASVKKNFLSNLADFCLVFILSFLLFESIGMPIFTHIGFIEEQESVISSNENELNKIVASTYLRSYNEKDKTLSEISEDAKSYVVMLTKTSFFLNEEKYPVITGSGTYDYVDVDIKDTFLTKDYEGVENLINRPSVYFNYVKPTDESIASYVYDGVDYSSNKDTYLYEKLFKYSKADFEEKSSDISIFEQLKFSKADLIKNYLVFQEAGEPNKAYEAIYNSYVSALSTLTKEVENKYTPYLNQISKYNQSTEIYTNAFMISLIICYVLALGLLEGIPPIFLKGHSTIGFRMMRCVWVSKEGFEPRFLNYLVKAIARLFTFFSGTVLCLFFTSQIGFIFVDVGWFAYYMIYLSAFGLTFASLVLILAGRPPRSIPERLSNLISKDLDMLEPGEAEEDSYGEITKEHK